MFHHVVALTSSLGLVRISNDGVLSLRESPDHECKPVVLLSDLPPVNPVSQLLELPLELSLAWQISAQKDVRNLRPELGFDIFDA